MTTTVPDLTRDGDPGTATRSVVGLRTARGRSWPDAGLGVLFAGALALLAARPLADNSFLTHLATGRIILFDGVPSTNPFLYSSADFPIPSWLWSVVLAAVDVAAGGTGIRILTGVLAALLGLLIVRLTRPEPGSPTSATRPEPGLPPRNLLSVVVPSACAFVALMPFLNARPQLPGYLLLASTVLVVKERRSPWWLVAVFAAWVDVHGTWVYGLAVLGLLVVVQAFDQRRVDPRRLLCVPAAAAGVALGGLLAPRPFQLVMLPLQQFGDDRARQALASYREWQPPGLANPVTWLLLAMGLVAVLGAVRSARWGALVGSAVMVAMGLSAGRLLPLAAITLVPWVAAGLAGLGRLGLPTGRTPRMLAAAGGILCVAALAWISLTPAYDLSMYPVTAVNWLERHHAVGRPDTKVMSHDFVGNYLDWRYGERANTFVDDRPGVDAALDYASLVDMTPGWRDALRRGNADVVIWRTRDGLTRKLSEPDWYHAGNFGEFSVFCRSPIADRCR